jgi:hypothetical protein
VILPVATIGLPLESLEMSIVIVEVSDPLPVITFDHERLVDKASHVSIVPLVGFVPTVKVARTQ